MTTTTSSTSTAVAVAEPVFSPQERLALAGFLAGYTGLTCEAYALDLRQYASWCQVRHLRLFQARRADIERFARDLEIRGRARATITRRLCTIAGFYRYAVEEELLEHSPGVSTGTSPISLLPTSRVHPGKNWLPSSRLRLAGPHRLGGGAHSREQRAPAHHPGDHKQRAPTADGRVRLGAQGSLAMGADLGNLPPVLLNAALSRGPRRRSDPPGCG